MEEVKQHSNPKSPPTRNIPEPVPMPDRWSPRVQAAIEANTLPMMCKQFIADAGSFYYGICRHPAQGDYRQIAIALCTKFPILRDPNDLKFYIVNEMMRMVGKDRVKSACDNLDEAVKRLLQKDGDITNLDLFNTIEKIEKATKRVGGKPIITFFETATKPEKMFKSARIEPKLICLGSQEDMRQFFIAAEDDCLVELSTVDLGESLLLLFYCYCVFDVRYPLCYFGILAFLQDIILKLPDDSFRGSKFASFISEFNSLPRAGI